MDNELTDYTGKKKTEKGIFWYKNGIVHRDKGLPAVIFSNADKQWIYEGQFHRKNAPSIEHVDGSQFWWLNGVQHREDGPAVQYANGYKKWFLYENSLTEDEFELFLAQKELKESPHSNLTHKYPIKKVKN